MYKLILFTLVSFSANAGDLKRYLKIRDLSIEATRAIGTNRDFIIPEGEEKQGDLNLNFVVGDRHKYFKLTTRVESMYTDRQFRYVSLTEELAYEPSRNGVEFFINHRSEHCLDCSYMIKYPNTNSIGVRIKFIED